MRLPATKRKLTVLCQIFDLYLCDLSPLLVPNKAQFVPDCYYSQWRKNITAEQNMCNGILHLGTNLNWRTVRHGKPDLVHLFVRHGDATVGPIL